MKTNHLPLKSGRKKQTGKKVLMALSGGIDSAVSAYLLLKQGYVVEAAFMKNWSSQEGLLKNECPWLEDRRDALRVAAFLGIKMHTLDFEKQYQNTVMKYFFNEYKKGRTPNPDVMCNKEIKFKLLYNWALSHGFDFLATGHYARVKPVAGRKVASSKSGYPLQATSYSLERSADEFKDQTYFIYNIKPQQLAHLLFPIGGMKKTAVKALAKKLGLPNAGKKESMGLCFVGKIRLKDFLEQKLKPKKGEIVLSSSLSSQALHPNASKLSAEALAKVKARDTGQNDKAIYKSGFRISDKADSGRTNHIIGYHQGLHNYTIGQRQGIKVGAGGPYFVCGKDLKNNRLYVTNDPNDPRLLSKELQIHSVNWISKAKFVASREVAGSQHSYQLPATSYQLLGRYRHQGELVPLVVRKIKNDLYRVVFRKPQKAVASGQSLVLYRGKECLGGGVIV